IELVIVLLEGGLGTTYLFNEVTVGSELTLRGPQGVFTLPDPIERDLFLVCTGTGIAPFRAMANHIREHALPHQQIHLIFGCRKLCDTLYGDELRELEKSMENFHYIPTYSRENGEDPHLRKGYVHAVYEEICQKNMTEGENGEKQLRPAHFY